MPHTDAFILVSCINENIVFFNPGKMPDLESHWTVGFNRNKTFSLLQVYAVNDVESYNIMEQLKKDIDKNLSKKDVHFLIIGTKLDLDSRRVDANTAVRNSCFSLVLKYSQKWGIRK